MVNNFDTFTDNFKVYSEETEYGKLQEAQLKFEAKILELANVNDMQIIVKELNEVAKKTFIYGNILENQVRILQKLEDEFDMWYAHRYLETKDELARSNSKEKFTETYIDTKIKVKFEVDYSKFKGSIRDEQFRLGLIKKVCDSLNSYGMKLHSIFKYRVEMEKSNL
jgi:hypothetical protein